MMETERLVKEFKWEGRMVSHMASTGFQSLRNVVCDSVEETVWYAVGARFKDACQTESFPLTWQEVKDLCL